MRNYFLSLGQMTKNILWNIRRIAALAYFEYKLGTKGMFLGRLWKLLSPLIQIGVYWLVFGVGLRSGAPVDGFPYVVWLTCGLTPWLAMNLGINRGAGSIYGKASMLTRSNIPTCLIPLSNVAAVFLDSCWTVLIMLLIYVANGCRPGWAAVELLYYIVCALVFVSALSLITSVLVMLARDFQNLIQAILRLVFFLSPVFWQPGDNLPLLLKLFDFCNPFGYIIRGFRNSLLYNVHFWENGSATLTFWGIVIVLYLVGSGFQDKLRRNLLDYL